jgi:hypothetical protein
MSFGIPVRNGLSVGLLASTFLTSGSGRLVPRLTLNFLTGAPLDSRITFTRSTTATFVGSDGLIQSSAINAARFDYNPTTLAPLGLLIEEQRVNLALYSEQFDNVAWVKTASTITANATTAPDGTLTADKITPDAGSAQHDILQTTSITTGVTYTITVFAKKENYNFIQLTLSGLGSHGYANFNLNTGTIGSTGNSPAATSITAVGNGWYRCSISVVSQVTIAGGPYIAALPTDIASRRPAFTGDGTSGIFIWGAQLEAGSFATSYIPTVASTVTRAADIAVMTGTNFSDWYNQSEGTVVASWLTTSVVVPTALGVFGVSDGSSNERIQIRRANSVNDASSIVVDGGVVQFNNSITASSGINTSALAYKVNDFISANNGTLGSADTSGTLPTPTQAEIGFGQGLTYLNGYVRSINYYATRLSNAQLQALSS